MICSTRRIVAVVALPLLAGVSTTAFGAGGSGARGARPDRRDRDAQRGARVRRAGVGRHHRRRDDPATASRWSTCPRRCVRVPGMFAANRQNYAQDLQISSRGFGARAHVRRARRAAVPGRHSGDDAGRAGADRQLQPVFGAAHRGAARAVLDAVRQCVGRRDLGVHRGRHARSRSSTFNGERRQLRHVQRRRRRRRGIDGGRRLRRRRQLSSTPTATATTRRRARDLANAKLTFDAGDATRRHADRQHAVPAARRRIRSASRARSGRPIRGRSIPSATLFDTRKTINQKQGGAAIDHALRRRHAACA